MYLNCKLANAFSRASEKKRYFLPCLFDQKNVVLLLDLAKLFEFTPVL